MHIVELVIVSRVLACVHAATDCQEACISMLPEMFCSSLLDFVN